MSLGEIPGIDRTDTAIHFRRIAQFQYLKYRTHNMATHVAKGASAVIPPSAPVERHQVFYIIPVGSGSQPQVPVQFFGYRSRLGRPGNRSEEQTSELQSLMRI